MNPTLLLPPRFSDDSNALWRAAIRLGWPIERLHTWRVPDEFERPAHVAIYGESLWASFVAEQLGFELYEPPLDWLAHLPAQFVGREIEFGTLEDARVKSFPLFVKPASEKEFEARVYDSANELPAHDDRQASRMVLMSQVVSWEVEYRCFVCDGAVQTASSYWRGTSSTKDSNGQYQSPPDELAAALKFVSQFLEHNAIDAAGTVIDVGILRGFGWAVVEANPAFASGIYGCDPAKVLEVVAKCPFQTRGIPPQTPHPIAKT